MNKHAKGRRAFVRLLKGIRPVDISGESEVIAEELPEDEAEGLVMSDLGPARHWPPWSSLTAVNRLTRVQSLLTAAITACVVLSLVTAGLIVLARQTPAQAALPVPRVLLQTTNLGNLSLPAWGQKLAPGSSTGGCIFLLPNNNAAPETDCTPGPVGHSPATLDQFLSFVDDWGNFYTWSQDMQKPTKSITLKASGLFVGDSYATWHWLYPGHYLLSYEQAPGSANTYKIWDTTQNRLLFTTTDTLPFAMSANGTIATLTAQHTVQILHTQDLLQQGNSPNVLNIQTAAETLSSPVFAQLVAISCSPDGSQLATATSDGTIQIWNQEFASGSELPLLTLHIPTNQAYTPPFASISLAWSPDGQHLAVNAYTNTGITPTQVWDLQSGRLIQSYSGNGLPLTGMVWMADSKEILASNFNQLSLWDTTTGRTLTSVQQGMTYLPTQSLSQISPNGRLLAVPLAYTLQLIDTHTGKQLRTLQGSKSKDFFVATAFSPDNIHLAALDIYGQLQVWNVQSGLEETSYRLPGTFSQLNTGASTNQGGSLLNSIAALAWSPDGRMLATTYQDGGLIVLGMPLLG